MYLSFQLYQSNGKSKLELLVQVQVEAEAEREVVVGVRMGMGAAAVVAAEVPVLVLVPAAAVVVLNHSPQRRVKEELVTRVPHPAPAPRPATGKGGTRKRLVSSRSSGGRNGAQTTRVSPLGSEPPYLGLIQ